jgi:DnaJ-class molecular chaperone
MKTVFKLIEEYGLTLHGDIEHFAEIIRADERKQVALDRKAENARELGLDYEPVWCGHCNGSGRMVRDPDIGTDQECFVCDGAGVPAAPKKGN